MTGNNTTNVTATATLTRISTALAMSNSVVYTGVANFVGTESLQVTVNDNGNTGAGGPMMDTKVVSIDVQGNKFEKWRTLYFSTDTLLDATRETTQWGTDADPDGDGCNNVLEYALGLDPVLQDGTEGVIVPGITGSDANQYLTITFNRRLGDPQLQYFPEVSADQQTWSTGTGMVLQTSVTPLNTDFERVTFQDLVPVTPDTPRFMRLRVVLTQP